MSVTKTLAKIASEFNKPDGRTIVPGRRIAEFLTRIKARAMQAALERLYQPGQLYRGCGVVTSEIRFAASVTHDLFGVMEQDGRQDTLLETMDAINGKYGTGTVRMLASLPLKRHEKPRCFNYPLFEAD